MVEMIRSKKMAGRAVLLAGPPGTGKVVHLYSVFYMNFSKFSQSTSELRKLLVILSITGIFVSFL